MNRIVLTSLATLALSMPVFADRAQSNSSTKTFYQGEILPDNCYPAAYNAPAKINLLNRCNKWLSNVVVDVSFIYWYAAQDGMELARSADLQSNNTVVFNNGSTALIQSFEYSPGFKLGLGWGGDEWQFGADYTWFRQSTSVNSNAPTANTLTAANTPVWQFDTWFAQGAGANNEFLSATNVNSSWHLGMDSLDVTGGRPFYQSKESTVSPYAGLRATWIRQSLLIAATVPAAAITGGARTSQPTYSHNHSNSWGLGPVFGAQGHCMFDYGFRVEADAGMSILFTQYTTLSHSEDSATLATTPRFFTSSNTNYNTVRPAANLGLGLGWGKYYCNGSYYLDLAADYEFNVLWNQNMMRSYADTFTLGTSSSNDLFLHGLTVTGKVMF